MKKKILIISGYDKWLVPIIIKKLKKKYNVSHYFVKKNNFTLKYYILNIISFGLLNSAKIFFLPKKNLKNSIAINHKNIDTLLRKKFDLKILVNYPFKINNINLKIYNFHPSILPNYKHLNVIPRIMYDKLNYIDCNYGSTIHKINEKFDDGKILWQKKLNVKKFLLNVIDIYKRCYIQCCEGINFLLSKKKKKINIRRKLIKNHSLKLNFKMAILIYIKRLVKILYEKTL